MPMLPGTDRRRRAMTGGGPAERANRTAVVGAGRIGDEHLAAIEASPDATLVGICDANPVLATFATRRYGGEAFTDLTELLATAQPDVLHVLTPPHLHVPMATEALASGAHVLVEKPMSLDGPDRELLLTAAGEADRLLIEDHNYRFNRPMLRLQRDIAAGHLGELVDAEVRIIMPLRGGNRYADRNLPSPSHRLPAGFVHEFITHLAYLCVALSPGTERAELLTTRWSRHVAGHASRFDELEATLLAGGLPVRLRFSARGPRAEIAVRATGTAGRAEAEMIFGSYRIERQRIHSQQLAQPVDAIVGGIGTSARGFGYIADRLRGRTAYEGLHELVRRFHHAARAGIPAPVTFGELRRTGELVDALIAAVPPLENPGSPATGGMTA